MVTLCRAKQNDQIQAILLTFYYCWIFPGASVAWATDVVQEEEQSHTHRNVGGSTPVEASLGKTLNPTLAYWCIYLCMNMGECGM